MKLGRRFSFLIGGARSGKSDLAVQLGIAWPGDVVLIATASAGDAEMERRIARHQLDRPDDWALIEAPLCSANDVTAVDESSLLIIDCVTMLVANQMFSQRTETEIAAHATVLADTLAHRAGPSIVISNEVGLGAQPEAEAGRDYRDVLGRVNRLLADRSETALFVSSGKVARLTDLEIAW